MAENCKDVAVAFLKMASSNNVCEAHSKFIAPDFKHLNPVF